MKLLFSEINLLLIVLLSVALVFIFILSVKIKRLKNEQKRMLSENKEDSRILFFKSRYASMGETVGNIAHQWKQPLNAIGAIQNSIKASLVFQGGISNEKLLDSVETSFKLLQHLAETIDTFYGFLAPRSDKNMSFLIADELEKIRKITEYSFDNSNIALSFILDANPTIQGNANEFIHAILNLVLNAKDALDRTQTEFKTITVKVEGGEKTCTIRVFDNGGGIRIEPIEMVFDLHITTKEEGSGLGLFMSKNIIENRFGGTVIVENKNGGACFTIELPYAEYDKRFSHSETSDEKLTLERIRQLTHKVIELEELEETLQKWAGIFEQAQWGIVIGTVEDQTLGLMNPKFARMHGYNIKELIGKKIATVFAPECLDNLQFAIDTAHQEGYYSFESVHVRKDGSRFPVTIELIAIKDEAGNVIYRIANVWDITERKAAEERLKLKKFALDHIKDAVFLIDENANFHYVNEGACAALGYVHKAFAHMNVGDVDPDWTQEWWTQHWNELKKVGSITMVLRHRRKDGSIFPVEVSANYIEFGDTHYNMAIARDITERLRLEQQKDNERMRLFFERQLVGMAITSAQKGWIHTNEKLQQMLGYTHEELSGLTWAEMTYPDDLATDVEQFEKLLCAEIEDYMLEKRFIRKDGTIVYTNLAVSCVRNDDHTVNYVLALLEDITERKQIEEQLQRSETSLKEAQKIAKMGSWTLELPSKKLTWSDETYRIFERSDKETALTQEEFLKYVHPEDRELVYTAYTESLETKLPFEIVHRLLMSDGRIKYVTEACATQYDAHGNPALSIGAVQDITERKRIEEEIRLLNTTLEEHVMVRTAELQKAVEFNEGIINAIPDLLFEMDINGRYLNIWAQNQEFLTAQKELLLGKTIDDVLSEDAAKTTMDSLKDANDKGFSFGKVIFIKLPERCGYFELSVSKKASTETFLILSRDITERKQAEEAIKHLNETLENRVEERTLELQKALEFNEGIINAIPDMLFEISPDGTYLGIWSQNQELLVAQKEVLLGKKFQDVLPPHAAEVSLRTMKEVDLNGSSLGNVYNLDLPDGEHWFELSSTKKTSEGTYLALSRDITARKRAEQKVQELNTTLEKRVIERTAQLQEVVITLHKEITERKEAEKQLKLVETAVNSSSEAIYINDLNLSILYVNDGACRMLGYSREELTKMKIYDIDAHFSMEQIFEIREDTAAKKQTFFETKHRTKDGRIIDVEITGNPFIYEGIEAGLSVVKDITEKIETDNALRKSEEAFRALVENSQNLIL